MGFFRGVPVGVPGSLFFILEMENPRKLIDLRIETNLLGKEPTNSPAFFRILDKDTERVTVQFDLPYLVMVDDSFADQTIIDYAQKRDRNEPVPRVTRYIPNDTSHPWQRTGTVVFFADSPSAENIQHGVYLPSAIHPAYAVNIGDGVIVEIAFLPRINQEQDHPVIGFPVGDTSGKIAYSSVVVSFLFSDRQYVVSRFRDEEENTPNLHKRAAYNAMVTEDKQKMTDNSEEFVNAAIYAINLLIGKYKVLNDAYFISPITKNTCYPYQVTWWNKSRPRRPIHSGIKVGPILMPLSDNRIGSENNALLREQLASVILRPNSIIG